MKRLPLLYLFFLLLSCNKETILEQGTVRGTVRDKTTNEGISGATVYLLSHIPTGGFGGGGGSTQINFTTSNTDGSFSFQLDYDSELAYTCAATHDLYFDYGDEFPVPEEIKVGENVEVNLQPKAWLRVHCVNSEPFNDSDYFNVSWNSEGPFYGSTIDTTLLSIIEGNINIHITWYVTKNSFANSYTQEIYCPAFDTTYYEIFY